MRCPWCGTEAPASAIPKNVLDEQRERLGPGAWPLGEEGWPCPDCLARRITAAHADDCRCHGCARRRADEREVA